MLTTTNKGGIRDSVYQWSQRKSIPEEVVNDFIEIALSTATRALRIPPLESFAQLVVTVDGYVLLPENYQEAKEVFVVRSDKNVLLERKAINEVDFTMNKTGDPCFFGRFGNYLRIAPYSGDGTELLSLYYYNIIPPMLTDDANNWFTMYAPEVLLYGALVELCNYTRDADGIAQWTAKFNESINIVQAVEDRAAWNGSTLSISLKGST